MAITLSENEKRGLDELFISLREKKSFYASILSIVSFYILEFKRENKRDKKKAKRHSIEPTIS